MSCLRQCAEQIQERTLEWTVFGPANCMQPSEPEVVVITGASAGVGRATVQAFAKRGARIGLVARGTKGLEGAKHDAERLGGQAVLLPTDVSSPEQVESAAQMVEATFGPIDIWVNAAMVSVFSPLSEMTPDEFHRVTEVTYLGTVYGTMAAVKRMLPRNKGTIVQVGSALSYRSIPLQSAYCGAKHAIRGFTDSLRTRAAARQKRRAFDNGPVARGKHTSILLGQEPLASSGSASPADLPAGSSG